MSAGPPRHTLKFALPPSMGQVLTGEATVQLEGYLTQQIGKRVEVGVSAAYDQMAKDLLAGRVDAAWAPPYVCARVESMGARVLVQGVRAGASTYRAALVCLEERPLSLETLSGKRAVWVDHDSVAGFLLPAAYLRSKNIDPQKTFFSQEVAGSYRAAVEAVASGRGDLTSVFAPSARSAPGEVTGLSEIAPDLAPRFKVMAFTEESPNDGVAVSPAVDSKLQLTLERVLLTLDRSTEGKALLRDVFHAETFEPAPRLAYRALYRVALASL